MILRPFTIIAGLLFVLSGAFLFVVKHQSQLLDAQLSATNEATTQDEQSIRVLQAQWALEADPSRLAALATQFTGLQPMQPGQLVTMAALGSSLPPPGAKPPGGNPEDPVPALPQLAAAPASASPAAPASAASAVASAAAASASPAAASASPAAAVAAPVQTASAASPEAPPLHLAAAAMLAPVTAALPVAAPRAAPRRHAATLRLASAYHHAAPQRREMGSALYLASATGTERDGPMGAQFMPVRAVASPAPAPVPAPAPLDDGGSLLGMAQGGSQ